MTGPQMRTNRPGSIGFSERSDQAMECPSAWPGRANTESAMYEGALESTLSSRVTHRRQSCCQCVGSDDFVLGSRQTEVLTLQAQDLTESLAERKRAAGERRSAQAACVFIA